MKYVLDASVAIRWVVPSLHSTKALKLRDDYLNGLHDLIAPDIFPGETASISPNASTKRQSPSAMQRLFTSKFCGPVRPFILTFR